MVMVEEIQDSSAVTLELDSQPESVALVRAMLCGVAELLGFSSELLDDLNTSVSEACNNVVRHAYAGGTGPLIVHLEADEECVEVTVRDEGVGLGDSAPSGSAPSDSAPSESAPSGDQGGVGLVLMQALADRVEFLTEPGGGTEVRIAFNRGTRRKQKDSWRREGRAGAAPVIDMPGDVVGTLAPVNLLGGVLGRMGRLLAARARFSLERFSDLYLLFDQLAYHASRRATSPRMAFALSAESKRLQLEIAPFGGRADASDPSAFEEPPAHLRVLADELTVEPVDDSLVLRVVVGGSATPSGA